MAAWETTIDRRIDALGQRLVAIRRHLHAHPEPSGEEFETSGYLAGLLDQAKLDVRMIPSRRGLVIEPCGQGDGPRVAMRGDIDALRVDDEKTVAYRSTAEGIAHACGHDAHATMIVGAALALAECADHMPWPVSWRALLQPAEETSLGAIEMVEAGAVDNVSAIVGMHVEPERRIGKVGFRSGTLTAYCDEIDVTIGGTGGHAARPHHAADPIAASAYFLSALYQLLPRTLDSREPLVLTFGSIHAGAARNVIPTELSLRGTARTHSREAREHFERQVEVIANGVSAATGCSVAIEFKQGPDAVINDARVTSVCQAVTQAVLGNDSVEAIEEASMGGEDFAEYLQHTPGCFFRLGVGNGDGTDEPLHSGHFDLDERALCIGAKILARSLVALSQPGALQGRS